jgi:NAD(P)H-hydrate epimerase
MKIVTVAQMVALEQAAARYGVGPDKLMENAGLAVAEAARQALGMVAGARVIVLVGPGNNGADGLVVARHLQRWGAEVTAYVVTRRPSPDPKMELAQRYGVAVLTSTEDSDLRKLDQLLARCRLVVDAVLGTGRARPLEGVAREVMLRLGAGRDSRRPFLLALDLPTGLNADTGEVDPACPTVDLTVTLGFPKVGLLTFPGASKVGQLRVVDIGLPPGLDEEREVRLELLTPAWVGRHLPARPPNSHKGTFGHALVVAGSRNYVGAAYLASQAAARVGAGLVTLAAPEGVYCITASKLTEVIHLPLPEDGEGRIHPDAAQVIRDNLSRYDAMLVGCGLGWSPGTTEFLERLLLMEPRSMLPTVVDADGLNNLSRLSDWWRRLGSPVALTPHPGEMATLTDSTTGEVQKDRIVSARQWAERWNVTVVLKGAYTVIAAPNGITRVSPFANPALASGGTGDVLTGIIGGLMAQGLSPDDASCCGVYLHGRAAEAMREAMGDTGTLATDLIARLPEAIKGLHEPVQIPGLQVENWI